MNDLDASESGGKDKYDVLRNCAGMGHAGEFPNHPLCDSPVNHLTYTYQLYFVKPELKV